MLTGEILLISLFDTFRFLSYLGMVVVIQVLIIIQDGGEVVVVVEVIMTTTGN